MAHQPSISIKVDRACPLKDQPHIVGHNRWHPAIKPVAHVRPGEIVMIETLDAMDGQVQPHHTKDDVYKIDFRRVHPLTGPFYIEGAEPGDMLEIEILDIVAQPYGYTIQYPGFGFLRAEFDEAFILHWTIDGGFATCPELPKVRMPAVTHMGVMGNAPSLALLKDIRDREDELMKRGGNVMPPDPETAVPADPAIASVAIRTISPHECGGNLDIKHLTRGGRLRIPVYVEGALFSTGDAHYCQGDGEVCGTPIECGATLTARFHLIKGEAEKHGIDTVEFYHEDYFTPPQFAAPRRFYATTGLSLNKMGGRTEAEDLNEATRNALRNMIKYLVREHGVNRQEAYAICSMAVDLKISQVVDAPNFLVSAVLPLDIFV